MDFQQHKICMIETILFTIIYMTAVTKCNVLKESGGPTLVNGCEGVRGRDGRDGRDGIQGPYGPPGLPGNVAMSVEFEGKLEEIVASMSGKLKDAIETGLMSLSNGRIEPRTESPVPVDTTGGKSSRPKEQPSTGGTTYVRWGRNACPENTVTLYSGIMAGSYYTHAGSGANHLCLPIEAQWNKTVAGFQGGSRLYGTEFEVNKHPGLFRNNAGGKSQHDHEVQCAVCQTPGRLTQLMIPARLECPSGWNREYLGFLMSGYYTHKRSEYVCVDQDPDVDSGTSASLNGNLLYPVEVACGSLPCPPYVEGYEVTCIVCTQ